MERKKLCLTKNLVDKRQKFFILLRYGVNLLSIIIKILNIKNLVHVKHIHDIHAIWPICAIKMSDSQKLRVQGGYISNCHVNSEYS